MSVRRVLAPAIVVLLVGSALTIGVARHARAATLGRNGLLTFVKPGPKHALDIYTERGHR